MRKFITIASAAALFSLCAAAAEPAPDALLAKKGDVEVTAGDFLAFVARLSESDRFMYRADVNRISNAASSIFVTRTLAQEARDQGLDREPEMQRRLRLVQEQLLAQVYMERFEKAIKTPDFEAHAREVYKADEARFKVSEKVQLKHILVSFQGRTEEEAKLRAEEARAKLVAGENFARVAREYSNDPNFRANDGLYQGSFNLFDPTVAEAARSVELNQPSPLIRTAEGYHVIVVLERLPAAVIPFEKAKKGLVEADEAKYRKQVVEKKLSSITQSKDVVLYTDEIAALATHLDREQLSRLHEEQAKKEIEEKRRLLGESSKPAGR